MKLLVQQVKFYVEIVEYNFMILAKLRQMIFRKQKHVLEINRISEIEDLFCLEIIESVDQIEHLQ